MGSQASATFAALLDATERVILAEGYAAATSRRIAREAGVKQQLVYYYFQTLDDLLLATFKRRTTKALERINEEFESESPAEVIWRNWVDRVDGKLNFEFMALANHHVGIREEVQRFVIEARKKHSAAIARQFEERGVDPGPLTPEAASFLLYCISFIMGREASTGITESHAEVRALVEWALAKAS